MIITKQLFKQYTGLDPQDDDLERCNCKKAGHLGHFCCGWNNEKNMPIFMVGTVINPLTKDKGE